MSTLTVHGARGTFRHDSSKGARLLAPVLHISASFAGSLADPAGSSVIVASVAWLEGTLLGTLATTAAIIAVASVGYMSLSGRLNIRHGATVILGCFVIFGASTIVAGIQSFVGGGSFTARDLPPVAAVPQPPPLPPAPRSPDPYAGASVPSQ